VHDAVSVLADDAVVAYLGVDDVRQGGEGDLVAWMVGAAPIQSWWRRQMLCSRRYHMSMRPALVRVAVQWRQAGRTGVGFAGQGSAA
jgi:hypothetical protein